MPGLCIELGQALIGGGEKLLITHYRLPGNAGARGNRDLVSFMPLSISGYTHFDLRLAFYNSQLHTACLNYT